MASAGGPYVSGDLVTKRATGDTTATLTRGVNKMQLELS